MTRNTILAVSAGLAMLVLSAQYGYSRWDYGRFERTLQMQIDSLAAVHRERLADAPRVARQGIARATHMEEWERRRSHDAELALTEREQALVRMQSLAQSGLSAVELLRQIATLTSPHTSAIQVRGAPGRYRVNVTFNLTAIAAGEEGSITKHRSIEAARREVVGTVCRIMRDLYRHGGTQNLRDITVSCQRGVLARELDVDKLRRSGMTMQELAQRLQNDSGSVTRERLMASVTTERRTTVTAYKATLDRTRAMGIKDWKRVPLHEIESILSRIEDEFPNMKLVSRTSDSSF